ARYRKMNVEEKMACGLKMRKCERTEIGTRVQEAAEILGIQNLLKRKPRQLSGGERQRVALGRAMVRHPRVFLFDEPLSNLDARLRLQTRAEIKRLHQGVAATMIYVTHDQVEAMTLGDRIVVLDKGRGQQLADPFTLSHRPANVFVAGFIGSPPMNFIPASVAAGDGDSLAVGGASVPLPADRAHALAPQRGSSVTVGVRPEDLVLQPRGPGGRLDGRVELREPLGHEVLVHWRTPAGLPVPRGTGDGAPQEGEQATLHFAFENARFFDPASGRALDPDPAAP